MFLILHYLHTCGIIRTSNNCLLPEFLQGTFCIPSRFCGLFSLPVTIYFILSLGAQMWLLANNRKKRRGMKIWLWKVAKYIPKPNTGYFNSCHLYYLLNYSPSLVRKHRWNYHQLCSVGPLNILHSNVLSIYKSHHSIIIHKMQGEASVIQSSWLSQTPK